MGAAVRIAVKDLKLRVRDKSVFILGIVAPLALAVIFNTVFGGSFESELGLAYGMVDLDGSDISAAFTSVLEDAESEEILTLESFTNEETASDAVDDGEIDAYIVIPSGFGEAVVANRTTRVSVVGDIDAQTSTQIAASFAEQFSSGVAASQLAVATAASVSGEEIDDDFLGSLSQDPAAAANSYAFSDLSARARQLDGATYLAAGMAVFFLFFTVQFGVAGILEEERQGTLPRLMAAPIPRAALVLGKAILAFVLGVVAMGLLVVATTLLTGADWGPPLGVLALIVAGVLAAVGIMGLVSAFARSPEGAGNLGAIIAVILGMLGGTFFPVASTGGVLATLSYMTPHAWFLRGLADISGGASWSEALPASGAMLVFAVVTGAIAWILMRRKWVR